MLADFLFFSGQRNRFLVSRLGFLLTAKQEIKRIACIAFFRRMGKQFGKAFFSQHTGSREDAFLMLLLHEAYGILRQIADNAFHITADIADFGKLGCFHFDKRRVDQLGKPAGNFGFADACRADHQDILRYDFIPEGFFHTASAVSVPQGDCDRLLGFILADNKTVQLMDNLAGGKLLVHTASFAFTAFRQ